jgi:Cu-Zn family superoxide dismutase
MYYYYQHAYPSYPVYDPYRGKVTVNRAFAAIRGSELVPELKGYVVFTALPNGTEVTVEVSGLPHYEPAHGDKQPIGPHGFHIHEHGDCQVGDASDPFQEAGGHWNPDNQPHGNHAGDFPVLFSNHGYSRMSFFTDRFKPQDVVGKSVIIHLNPDDYRTQPSGNSGKRIGCGVIQAY